MNNKIIAGENVQRISIKLSLVNFSSGELASELLVLSILTLFDEGRET
jgi:hypothetical protein